MAQRGTSSMDFYKFCLIAFLIFNNGFPIKGVPESNPDGSKSSPSAKECRAHIEAALDKYWETGEGDKKDKETTIDSTPDQSAKSLDEGPQHEDEPDQDDDDTDPPVDLQDKDEAEEGEDDTDEDDENEDDEDEDDDDVDKSKETPEEELDEDDEDEEDEDDEDDEDETAEEEISQNAEPDEEEDEDEDDEEDDETEEEEEEEEEDKAESLKEHEGKDKEDVEEEDEDEEGEDEDEEGEDEDKEGEDEDEEDEEAEGEISKQEESNKTDTEEVGDEKEEEEEEAEEEEEEEEAEEEVGEEAEEEVEEEAEEEVEEKAEEEEEEEEEEEGEGGKDEEEEGKEEDEEEEEDEEKEVASKVEEEEDEEEEEEEEEKHKVAEEEEEEEENAEDEEEDDEEADDEEEEEEEEHSEEEKETISLQEDLSGDKVTGETHSAAAGMAPELSETKPVSDKPKTSPVEEKAALETPPEEDEEEEEEEEEEEAEDEDLIENIYEEEDEEDLIAPLGETLRSRDHVDAILGLDDIGTDYDMEEEKLAQSVFRDIKKIHTASIKPMEMLYKYGDSTTRVLGDAEIFSKPMVLFLGPWSSGKTTIINYLLGLERTSVALKTGTGITDLDFTVINYGEQRRITSGTALAAEWRYAGVQKFGQGFLDHFKGLTIPHTLLKKITVVDTPGIIESKKNDERGYPFNDAFQWFIDRADAIYVVLDPTKVDIGAELGSVLDQLKGREVRFILNKADTIRRSDLMRVVGQLFWNLSPLMSSTEAPVIYAVSLTTKPFHPSAPARFLADQEKNFLYDLRDTIDKHVENRIRYARRHAVRVRNHCKMVDCYLATYYRHKSIFSSKKNVAKLITENPDEYNIYEGLSSMTNVSRYDLPDPVAYKSFFRMHLLYDFKPLASTCSYFRGCPMDKLDFAISNELPELLAKYKKAKVGIPAPPVKEEGR